MLPVRNTAQCVVHPSYKARYICTDYIWNIFLAAFLKLYLYFMVDLHEEFSFFFVVNLYSSRCPLFKGICCYLSNIYGFLLWVL